MAENNCIRIKSDQRTRVFKKPTGIMISFLRSVNHLTHHLHNMDVFGNFKITTDSFCSHLQSKLTFHSWFLCVQNVPIRTEYTGRPSLERALIWHIKHEIWWRVSKVISILSSWVNCPSDSGYGIIGRILLSARTRTGLCLCRNKASFHTKKKISFVLLENIHYFTEQARIPKLAQN